MKHSVDLTENHVFSGVSNTSLDILSGSHRHPWDDTLQTVHHALSERELVFTGDAHTIKTKRFCSTFSGGSTCDCCGEDLMRIPWGHSSGTLCNKCLERMSEDSRGKFPWEETESRYSQRVENLRDRVIIESEYKGEIDYE